MPKQVMIDMKRVKSIDAKSKKVISSYVKETNKKLTKAKSFVLDLSKMQLGGVVALCKCQCSSTMDCGGGGGGS